MTGLDTNILLRYFVGDDPRQSRTAAWVIERDLTEQHPGYVSLVAMVETVWTLLSSYELSRDETASIIERMLQIETLTIQNEQAVFVALVAFQQGKGSFADTLIGALGIAAGCDFTVTFDKKAARLGDYKLL
jgi:predicted nucleic-acid-binding protein